MALKNGFITVGFLREKHPVFYTKGSNYPNRIFIVRRIMKKNKKWIVDDIEFLIKGEACEKLDTLLVGDEVEVKFDIDANLWIQDNEIKRKNNSPHPVVFQSLLVWDIYLASNKKAKDIDWKVRKWQEVGNEKIQESNETMIEQNKKETYPNTKTYTAETFNVNKDYSDKKPEEQSDDIGDVEDDLPF